MLKENKGRKMGSKFENKRSNYLLRKTIPAT
jgi:hypothetical protein